MKSSRTLKAAGLVLIAVVLGLLTVQGSYALWNKSASSNAGTIQAADFNVTLAKNLTDEPISMTTSEGTAATLQLSTTSIGALNPGDKTYSGVQVRNSTNASGVFTIRAIAGIPVITNTPGSSLAQHLSIQVATAESLDQCTSASFTASTPPTPVPLDIANKASGVFCFQVSMAADMPASANGKTASISVPITVNQL